MKLFYISTILTFGLASTALACPDFNQSGPGETLSGSQMRQGVTYSVDAGGENFLGDCRQIRPETDSGPGYFTTVPDFTFFLEDMGRSKLVVSVFSDCDAALLINTGAVNWYYDDDDNGNQDPKIILTRPSDGYLDVWVGTYDGQVCDAVLQLQTVRR
jgi:hypothetical protein